MLLIKNYLGKQTVLGGFSGHGRPVLHPAQFHGSVLHQVYAAGILEFHGFVHCQFTLCPGDLFIQFRYIVVFRHNLKHITAKIEKILPVVTQFLQFFADPVEHLVPELLSVQVVDNLKPADVKLDKGYLTLRFIQKRPHISSKTLPAAHVFDHGLDLLVLRNVDLLQIHT